MKNKDWKKLFIALTDACLSNESVVPNLANIHEEKWVGYDALTKKEIKVTDKLIDKRHKKYREYLDGLGDK